MDDTACWAVVPAAGVGKRMGAACPKQYLNLGSRRVIEHTLERLLAVPEVRGVVVCVAADDPYWDELALPPRIVRAEGGSERCHSVLNGLRALRHRAGPDDWVLVHDAARPCVRVADIRRLLRELARHPVGGLLALPVRDTMKRAGADRQVSATVDRDGLWHALTPQMFRLAALEHALQAALDAGVNVTDDAQAMELQGHSPVLVEGHADNIKITHPQDLALAALYLQQQREQT